MKKKKKRRPTPKPPPAPPPPPPPQESRAREWAKGIRGNVVGGPSFNVNGIPVAGVHVDPTHVGLIMKPAILSESDAVNLAYWIIATFR